MGLNLFSRKQSAKRSARKGGGVGSADDYQLADVLTVSEDPLKSHLQTERYGALAADAERWADYPGVKDARKKALEKIDERFAMVPDGCASLPQTVNDDPGAAEIDVETAAYLLSLHPITQAQYQLFVDDGGYEQLELWPQDIWPHLIDFKDLSGHAAPRYWREGRHDRRLCDHPIVGICHFEASAYANWAGYRLPSEAEWQMAASWRIRSSAQTIRRYPWGDALDINKCNIWSSGVGQTVPVDEYEDGAAPNGVVQLVGNVWEWVNGIYDVGDGGGGRVVGDMVLQSIRGGAYDTYFASQATSTFRTGLVGLARVHNVGFRCAMDVLS